jgi:hypothetical protein
MTRAVGALAVTLAATACLGDATSQEPAAPDAAAPAGGDAAPAEQETGCALPAQLGSFGALFEPFAGDQHQATPPPGEPDARTLFVTGAIGEPRFRIAFNDGRGVFADGTVTTGFFDLTGPDDGIAAEVVVGDTRYQLTAGKIAIDAVDGSLTCAGRDVRLADGDCETVITLVEFDAPIVQVRATGEACDPEPCEDDNLCVGTRASNRVCRHVCEDTAECIGVDECRDVGEDARACLPPLQ